MEILKLTLLQVNLRALPFHEDLPEVYMERLIFVLRGVSCGLITEKTIRNESVLISSKSAVRIQGRARALCSS